MNTQKQHSGFTLIEVLITLAISSVVMLSIYSLFMMQIRINSTHDQVVEVQQNIRSAMFLMEREIKMAGFKGSSVNLTTGFSDATPATMTFTYVADFDDIDNDEDGSTDEGGEIATISYLLFDSDADGSNDDLGRTVNGVTTAIAENVQNVEFYYTGVDTSGVTQQSTEPSTLVPPLALDQIQSVQVTLLARSRKAIKGVTSRAVFNTPSGVTWGTDAEATDGFYRRLTTSNIVCRNVD